MDQFAVPLALVGTLFLFFWWGMHYRSGARGFLLALLGSASILLVAEFWEHLAALAHLAHVGTFDLVASCGFLMLLMLVIVLLGNRRHAAEQARLNFPAAHQKASRCPECKQMGLLHEYAVAKGTQKHQVKRICSDCAGRQQATFLRG
jgi:hypothetical protein